MSEIKRIGTGARMSEAVCYNGIVWVAGQVGTPGTSVEAQTVSYTHLDVYKRQTELGLMAYGHREKGSCDDIELIVPPATGTAKAISEAAAKLQFKGKTPLTEAVRLSLIHI